MTVDLHMHSDHSDGTWTPRQLVEHAVNIGMSCIALTDHDTIFGVGQAEEAAAGRLTVIAGLEINTVYTDEEGIIHDVHILGHFIDTGNEELQALLKRQVRAREKQAQEIVEKLNREKVWVTMAQLEELACGSPIGKTHIARSIVAAGGADDIMSAYTRWCSRGSPDYIERESASPLEAVRAIATAGGVSTIAHPGDGEHVEALIEELSKAGLSGIEVYHRFHDQAVVEALLELAGRLDLVATGGSDCHGPFEEHESLIGTVHVPPDAIERLRARAQLQV